MKKNILLLQFRKNNLVARHEKMCILRGLGNNVNLIAKNIFRGGPNLSEIILDKVSGIIIGGSGEFSFSRKEKTPDLWKIINSLTPFIKKAIKGDVPILGICFGHQYLARILGSKILCDESQREAGTFKICLTKIGRQDPLFSKIPLNFLAQEGHEDSIKKLPRRAILLAVGKKCKIQAFRLKNIYGIQFHPELSSFKDLELRSRFYPHYISGAAKIDYKPSPFAKKIIKNFAFPNS